MTEFQIKTSDGSSVDILIKPLTSGLVVKKIRELTEKSGDPTSPGAAKKKEKDKDKLKSKSPQNDRKESKDALKSDPSSSSLLSSSSSSSSSSAAPSSSSASAAASLRESQRKTKSSPHMVEGAPPPGAVSFASEPPAALMTQSAGATGAASPDTGNRARSKTMSAHGSPLAQQRALKEAALKEAAAEGGAPSTASRHVRKGSDPIVTHSRSSMAESQVFSSFLPVFSLFLTFF